MTSQDPRPSSENTLSTPQVPQYVYPTYYPAHQDDEIDLFELLAALHRRRFFIISVTALTALLSLIYVSFVATPTYEVKALLKAPADSTVLPLRARYTNSNSNSNSNKEFNNESIILNVDAGEALARFQTAIESRALQRQIFDTSLTGRDAIPWSGNPKSAVKSLDQLFISDFLARLSISYSKIDKNALVTTPTIEVQFLANVPAAGAEIVNHLITSANQQATDLARQDFSSRVEQLINESESALAQAEAQAKSDDRLVIRRKQEAMALEVAQLELEIAAKRDLLAREHTAQLQALQDALVVAERLEITDNKLIGASADSTENPLLSQGNGNLYLRGTKALQAQIDVLKNQPLENLTSPEMLELERLLQLAKVDPEIDMLERRTDYAAFVPNGEELRRQIAELRSLRDRDLTDLNFVQIDLPALEPAKPIKPKKSLIVAGATLASAMLAMMIALILNMRDNRRKAMQD